MVVLRLISLDLLRGIRNTTIRSSLTWDRGHFLVTNCFFSHQSFGAWTPSALFHERLSKSRQIEDGVDTYCRYHYPSIKGDSIETEHSDQSNV